MSHTYQTESEEITVMDYRCVVEMKEDFKDNESRKVKEKITASGLVLPEMIEEKFKSDILREDGAQEQGTLVAKGTFAFKEIPLPHPEIGDIVVFRKYSGTDRGRTKDCKLWHKVINDDDVMLIVKERKDK